MTRSRIVMWTRKEISRIVMWTRKEISRTNLKTDLTAAAVIPISSEVWFTYSM